MERERSSGAQPVPSLPSEPMSLTGEQRAPWYIRDLASLLALPRAWRGRAPDQVASHLLDVLTNLLRLDAASVKVFATGSADEITRFRPSSLAADAMARMLAGDGGGEAATIDGRVLRLMRIPIQVDAERALVVLGSAREDFPTSTEAFLARVAVEQAVLAIHATRLVESLRQANAAKATFLATMSHELRTPLNAIIGYSELLQTGISGALEPTQARHVDRIDTAARHLLALIEGILNFARLEAGKEKVHVTEADGAAITAEVVQLVEPLARRNGLALSSNAEPGTVPMRTDASKLRQILLNLLSNALKFTPRGSVRVELSFDEAQATWRVIDTGVGIAESDLERVFEPFQQLAEAHAHRAPGTGLGLSVSRQLAHLMDGDLRAESAPGGGTIFTLRLPRLLAERP